MPLELGKISDSVSSVVNLFLTTDFTDQDQGSLATKSHKKDLVMPRKMVRAPIGALRVSFAVEFL